MLRRRSDEIAWRIVEGDCVDVMAAMPDASIDAIVCDPPYGLGFMGKDWDSPGGLGDMPMRRNHATNMVNTGASRQGGRQRSTQDFAKRQARDARSYQEWCEAWATAALRVLKPGGHLLAFGGTRTYHRLAAGIEDAGFEVRDMVEWLYGSGFPKSLDVSKAIDRAAGVDREIVGRDPNWRDRAHTEAVYSGGTERPEFLTAPATPEAQVWDGWGTALKPAHEPVCVARKSLQGTVAANVLAHGTGAINVDGCRIGTGEGKRPRSTEPSGENQYDDHGGTDFRMLPGARGIEEDGRWPANVVLDEDAGAMLDEQSGILTSGSGPLRRSADKFGRNTYGEFKGTDEVLPPGDSGGASRFFYVAKADTAERNAGLATASLFTPADAPDRNDHPTVKPIDLMRWLVRLVTPPGGTVLDPFTGSGTTGCVALLEGFSFIGIEREDEYAAIARARLAHWSSGIEQEAA